MSQVVERQVYTPAEVAQMLGICVNEVYQAVEGGRLPALRVNRKILMPKADIHRLLGMVENSTAA